ncbi:MAG: peptidoglycan recognition protein family protein, partial [Planctomycetota bacterium]
MLPAPKSASLRRVGTRSWLPLLLGCTLLATGCRIVRAPEPAPPAEAPTIVTAAPEATAPVNDPVQRAEPTAIEATPTLVPVTAPDWIIVAGQRFPTGTRVVTWLEPDGYNAYQPTCHDDPSRVLPTRPALTPEVQALRGDASQGPFDLTALRAQVNQFVVHYDVAYTSANCFHILHDVRGLSVHFMLDLDGTVYQTCDLTERARHAGSANDRSVGIEIAHPGPLSGQPKLEARYLQDEDGVYLSLPKWLKKGHLAKDYRARPARTGPVEGKLHGNLVRQHDFTEAQYKALTPEVQALRGDASQGPFDLTALRAQVNQFVVHYDVA